MTVTYRKLTPEEQVALEAKMGIKKPMFRYEGSSLSIISENCWFCTDPWKYELEIAIRDSENKLIPGRFETVNLCEKCRKEKEPMWGSDRVREVHVRVVKKNDD